MRDLGDDAHLDLGVQKADRASLIAWRKQVGARLKNLRKTAGLTQLEMARLAGMENRAAWSRYEHGDIEPPTFKLQTLCVRMKVSMDYLYRGSLSGVHPTLGMKLAEHDSELIRTTNRIRKDMGRDPL